MLFPSERSGGPSVTKRKARKLKGKFQAKQGETTCRKDETMKRTARRSSVLGQEEVACLSAGVVADNLAIPKYNGSVRADLNGFRTLLAAILDPWSHGPLFFTPHLSAKVRVVRCLNPFLLLFLLRSARPDLFLRRRSATEEINGFLQSNKTKEANKTTKPNTKHHQTKEPKQRQRKTNQARKSYI